MNDEVPAPDADAQTHVDAPERTASHRGYLVALVVVAVLLACDQLTKWWAAAVLADGPIDVIGTTVQFSLTRNPGGSFSLFQGFTPVLALLAIVIVAFLVHVLRKTTDTWMIVGLSLLLAGALGNLADRLFRAPGFLHGEVVDFIKVGWWPTFNIADSAITVGVVLLLVRSFRRR